MENNGVWLYFNVQNYIDINVLMFEDFAEYFEEPALNCWEWIDYYWCFRLKKEESLKKFQIYN